jgi:hypothetical protein
VSSVYEKLAFTIPIPRRFGTNVIETFSQDFAIFGCSQISDFIYVNRKMENNTKQAQFIGIRNMRSFARQQFIVEKSNFAPELIVIY